MPNGRCLPEDLPALDRQDISLAHAGKMAEVRTGTSTDMTPLTAAGSTPLKNANWSGFVTVVDVRLSIASTTKCECCGPVAVSFERRNRSPSH